MLAFFLDFLRPPQADGIDPMAEAYRYRMVMRLAFGLSLLAMFYIALDIRSGASVFSLGMTGLIGMAGVIRVMVHRRRPIAKIGQVVTIGLFLAATFVTLHSGVPNSASLAWFALLPLSAALLSGPRAGMGWAAVSLVSVLIFSQLAQLGAAGPEGLPERGQTLYKMLENLVLLAGVASLMSGFLSEHHQKQGELEAAQRELEEERHGRAAADQRVRETLQVQNQILAKVGSEMRVPLTGIQGMTRMLNGTELDKVQKDYASAISKSGTALMELLEDVLDFSRIESGELELEFKPFDIEVAVAGVAKHLANGAEHQGVEILLRFAPETPRFFTGDAGRIQQVLGSMVKNSVGLSDEGHVLIDVEEVGRDDHKTKLRFHVRANSQNLSIEKRHAIEASCRPAEDDGEGPSQSGFGLALSQRILSLMGGQMGFEHDEDRTDLWFTLELPRSREPKVQNLFSGNLAGLKALVVEDNSCNRDILVEQLMEWGVQPVLASSGQEAIRMMQVGLDDKCPYQLAVIDHQLPDMDGKRLGMMMMSDPILEECCMVLLTSEAGAGRSKEFRRAGFSAYLAKPVTPSILRDTLAMAWGLHSEEKQRAAKARAKL
ncbi:MAG: histidine kinase dimerization/phospho-acceptor domain-containing protein [Planctomycetota bacterium]